MRQRHDRNSILRRSYWLSASNYYVSVAAIAIAVFFLVLGLLHDDGNELPWVPAGIVASATLFGAVIVRRVVIQRIQMRVAAAERLDRNLRTFGRSVLRNDGKLTIEKNAAILRELKRKSDAALVLARYADGHREVFELCSEYLEINDREMRFVGPGSPRIAALRRGREIAEDYHRRHMLKWAEIEARSLLEAAQTRPKVAQKLETAIGALTVIRTAAERYPAESRLTESAVAIEGFIVKVKVTDLVERGGRAAFRGNRKQAEKLLTTALRQLENHGSADEERALAGKKIREQLEKLKESDR